VSYLRRFGRFWWNFVVGDNLPLALGAGVTIAVTALLVDEGINAWWLLPTSILALLAVSVGRVADPDNFWDSLRRERNSSALRTAARSHATRDERRAASRAPETLGADTRTARFIGEASMHDVERLGD
jgi:hypothetical protein